MYFQYPLETLARGRDAISQLDFASGARRFLQDTDELLFEPIPRGLAIFAANETVLEHARTLLHDIYGERVEVRPPKVRCMPGDPPREPIMHVRVETVRQHAEAVGREMRQRGARILEQCVRGSVAVVRAEAPLAVLLGLPTVLEAMTRGNATCAIRLVRYSPLPPDLGGKAA